jgi:hypothetical protein
MKINLIYEWCQKYWEKNLAHTPKFWDESNTIILSFLYMDKFMSGLLFQTIILLGGIDCDRTAFNCSSNYSILL